MEATEQQASMQAYQAVAERHFSAKLLRQAMHEWQRRAVEKVRKRAREDTDRCSAHWTWANSLKRRVFLAWRHAIYIVQQ